MDIQISSNFERLLFDAYGRDGRALAKAMAALRATGAADFGRGRWKAMRALFVGHRLGDDETKLAIRTMHKLTGELLDPHSAIGVAAGLRHHDYRSSALVALATAHPAKFPDAVEAATGVRPRLPERLKDLHARAERCAALPNDLATVQDFVAGQLKKRSAA
jgi:threonine synthase